MSKHRFAALDSTFLLALGAGEEDCEAVIDWLNTISVYPLVTPTVIQELVDIEENEPTMADDARRAKECLTTCPILAPQFAPTENGIASIIARRLVEQGGVPDEYENDGLVLAEAGLQQCIMLITYREDILKCSMETVKLILVEHDVSGLFAVSPPDIVAFLSRKPQRINPVWVSDGAICQ